MCEATDVIGSEAEIRQILGDVFPSQVNKVIDHIDAHCRAWIERSRFIVVSTAGREGASTSRPRATRRAS